MVARLCLAAAAVVFLAGCNERDPCPNGAMTDGPEGLVVTQAEHPDGWGKAECFTCHDAAVLHRTGCTPDVDLAAIRAEVDAAIAGEAGEGPEGESVDDHAGDDAAEALCADCHGTNGVSP